MRFLECFLNVKPVSTYSAKYEEDLFYVSVKFGFSP